MNKRSLLTLTIVILLLAACASNSPTTASGSTSSKSLPMQTQLILGTLKLEETANAVTAEQAAELLPMWYVLKELNSSNTAAQDEIDGLVFQIQSTLTKDQTQAIADMELDAQDMMTVMQQSVSLIRSSNSPQTGAVAGASGGGAGGPPDMGGGMPADPGGMPGAAPSTGTISTSSDSSASPVMGNGTPSALFDAVIELLQKKVES